MLRKPKELPRGFLKPDLKLGRWVGIPQARKKKGYLEREKRDKGLEVGNSQMCSKIISGMVIPEPKPWMLPFKGRKFPGDLASLGFCFLIYKMGLIIVSIVRGIVQIKWDDRRKTVYSEHLVLSNYAPLFRALLRNLCLPNIYIITWHMIGVHFFEWLK